MNLVYVTPFLRVPADFGLGIRNYHFLKHLTEKYTVRVVAYGVDETGQTDKWLAERGSTITRLPFAFPWHVAYTRWDSFKRLYEYPPGSFRRYPPAVLGKCLNSLIGQDPNIDVVLLDTQFAGQVLVHQPLAKPCVLMLADIQQTLLRRALTTISWRPIKAVYLAEWLKTRAYEQRILDRHHHIVVVSRENQEYVAAHCKHPDIALIPNGVDTRYFAPAGRSSKNDTLLFVGGFEYGPNVDAFHYFYREILPIVRTRRPGVRFVAAGRNPPESIKSIAAQDPEVLVTGTVDDVRPYYAQASVVVVPLRQGSGTKLKLLEAFAMGVPVVATSVGCEGIAARDGEHLAIAVTPRIFADKVVRFLEHPVEAQAVSKRARTLVEQVYDWAAITTHFDEWLTQGFSGSSPSPVK